MDKKISEKRVKKIFTGAGIFSKRSSGFTLVEALITTVLFSMLLGACLMLLLSGSESWQVNSVQVEIQQDRRRAMDWMREELLQTGSSVITTVPADGTWYNSITFRTAAGISGGSATWSASTITYARGGTGGNQLIRTYGATTRVLANNITTLQFRRQASTPSVLEVSMVSQKNTLRGATLTGTTSFKVKIRN